MTAQALMRVGVGGPLVPSFNVGDVWQVDFMSDKPASPQQFFTFVSDFQTGTRTKTLSFGPIDETHYRATIQWLSPGAYKGPGESRTIDGIKYTITDAHPVAEEKKFSTGEVVGIAVAGAAAVGTVIYLATRKKRHRRRR